MRRTLPDKTELRQIILALIAGIDTGQIAYKHGLDALGYGQGILEDFISRNPEFTTRIIAGLTKEGLI